MPIIFFTEVIISIYYGFPRFVGDLSMQPIDPREWDVKMLSLMYTLLTMLRIRVLDLF